ncbi:hypothetical protein [Sorangium sp. So ce341]|uniref:hypothetical protein n=1 Tax=Sorangium sp. So ce341 TaxID=3133302 RepID=UPI003F641843
MRSLNIKSISTSAVEQPRRSVTAAMTARARAMPLAPRNAALLGSGEPAPMRELTLPEDELASQTMVRVDLVVDGALPTTNYANFWVGDQLLLGTMVDEGANKITGYVRKPVEADVRVRVEFPNGTDKVFNLRRS